MKLRIYFLIGALVLFTAAFLQAQTSSTDRKVTGFERLGSPTSVQAELEEDRIDVENSGLDNWNAWKDTLSEQHGLKFSFEYNSLGQIWSTSAVPQEGAAGGLVRAFGSWTLVNQGEKDHGSLVFRIDNRHRYSTLDPQNGSIAAGSASPTGTLFSNREWGVVNLQWSQAILDGRGGFVVGFTPADDYFHAYGLANPLTAFSNLAFSTGGEIALPDTGLGVAGGLMLDENFYVKGGVHDANGMATDLNFDVFGDWELFKDIELGWVSSRGDLYTNNFHIGAWHSDARTMAGVQESWGFVGNASWYFEDSGVMPFIRGGWSDGAAPLLNGQVSAGLGKQCRERDLAGVGVAWGRPSTPGLKDQWTTELFYRIQLGNLAITPSVQFIRNPSFNLAEGAMIVGGLRGRVVF